MTERWGVWCVVPGLKSSWHNEWGATTIVTKAEAEEIAEWMSNEWPGCKYEPRRLPDDD